MVGNPCAHDAPLLSYMRSQTAVPLPATDRNEKSIAFACPVTRDGTPRCRAIMYNSDSLLIFYGTYGRAVLKQQYLLPILAHRAHKSLKKW